MRGTTREEPLVASAIEGLKKRPVRPSVVRRVGDELQSGTYDPPIDMVVDRLMAALVRPPRPPGRAGR